MSPKTLAVAALISFVIPTSVVAKTATQNNPNQIGMLSSIAQQYAKAGQKQKASELITQALPLVDNISSNCDKPKPMATIAGNYARVGQENQANLLLEQAIKITKTAKGCNSTNDSVENLLDISNKYIEEGLYDLALQSVKGLDDASSFYQVYGLSLIARDWAKSNKVDQVNALTTEILNVAQSIKDANQRAFALSRGAYELIEAQQNTQAIKLLAEAQKAVPAIQDVDGKPNTLLFIARAYNKLGQPTEAIKLLEQATLATQKVSNPSFRINNLGAIGAEYAAVNQKPKANLLLEQALTIANKTKPASAQDDLLLTVAGYTAKTGQYDQAIKIAKGIKSREYQAAALSRIAGEVARQEKFDLALQIAQRQIGNAAHKAGAIMEITRALVAAKQFDKAVAVAQSINRKYEKAGVLSEIALKYAENGNPDEAINLINTINKFSASLSDEANDIDWMLPVVAQSYAKAGNFDRAIKVAESIKITQHRVNALTKIANEYSDKGQKDKSLLLLAQAVQLVK
ncbi:MAG: tetratricopeptide repeat protein [Calothrix sp. FI2-JRJ7]|jgi:tetratricopeptide (TPR) repeat protein|nr:tetratricopeptide repeat protein [Calothrix sp. FI2-JRJ7]